MSAKHSMQDIYLLICFLADPTTVLLTFVANRKEQSDSPRCAASGERLHIIRVLLDPDR